MSKITIVDGRPTCPVCGSTKVIGSFLLPCYCPLRVEGDKVVAGQYSWTGESDHNRIVCDNCGWEETDTDIEFD